MRLLRLFMQTNVISDISHRVQNESERKLLLHQQHHRQNTNNERNERKKSLKVYAVSTAHHRNIVVNSQFDSRANVAQFNSRLWLFRFSFSTFAPYFPLRYSFEFKLCCFTVLMLFCCCCVCLLRLHCNSYQLKHAQVLSKL